MLPSTSHRRTQPLFKTTHLYQFSSGAAFLVAVCWIIYVISISTEIRGREIDNNGIVDRPSGIGGTGLDMTMPVKSTRKKRRKEALPQSATTTTTSPPKISTTAATVVIPTSKETWFSDQLNAYFNGLSEPTSETEWIREYVLWHHEIRLQFPDTQLFDHPDAPPLMIAWYRQNHLGGLTDRSKCLGDLLKQAKEAKRLLLLKWFQAPLDLEAFLEPRFLNFTLPHHPTTANYSILGDTYGSSNRKKHKKGQRIILTRLNQDCDVFYRSPFHVVWHILFQPTPAVQKAIDTTMTSLNLIPEKFDAVHCRVTHPAFLGKTSYRSKSLQDVDSQGAFHFEGEVRTKAVEAAIHGIHCANWVATNTTVIPTDESKEKGSIYFFSDSHDLVRFMVKDPKEASSQDSDAALVLNVTSIQSQVRIVGRSEAQVAHLLNSNEDTPLDAFISAFVDIYVASQARCLSLGVGNYAYLSAKIKSGPVCWVRHQSISDDLAKRWGMVESASEIPNCSV